MSLKMQFAWKYYKSYNKTKTKAITLQNKEITYKRFTINNVCKISYYKRLLSKLFLF